MLRKSQDSTDPTVYDWWVPLSHTNDFEAETAYVWMSDTEKSKRLVSLAATNDQWVIFNVDQQGAYF